MPSLLEKQGKQWGEREREREREEEREREREFSTTDRCPRGPGAASHLLSYRLGAGNSASLHLCPMLRSTWHSFITWKQQTVLIKAHVTADLPSSNLKHDCLSFVLIHFPNNPPFE